MLKRIIFVKRISQKKVFRRVMMSATYNIIVGVTACTRRGARISALRRTNNEQKLWRARDRMSAFLMFPRRKAAELKDAGQELSASSGAPPRKRSPSAFSADVIAPLLHLPLAKAASALGVSATSLKKICRHFGMGCWPYRRPCLKARGRLMLRNKLDGCDDGTAMQQVAGPLQSVACITSSCTWVNPAALTDTDYSEPGPISATSSAACRQNRDVHVEGQVPAMPVVHKITGGSPESQSPTVPLQPRCLREQLSRASPHEVSENHVRASLDAAVLGMEGTLWRPSVANNGPGADEGINETDLTTCGGMPQHYGDNTDDLEWILFGTGQGPKALFTT